MLRLHGHTVLETASASSARAAIDDATPTFDVVLLRTAVWRDQLRLLHAEIEGSGDVLEADFDTPVAAGSTRTRERARLAQRARVSLCA
jgi:hypothetical protein